jgi:hypothetical protein
MQLTVKTGTVRPFGNVIESNYPPDLLLPICFLLALYVGTYHLNIGNYLDIFLRASGSLFPGGSRDQPGRQYDRPVRPAGVGG